MCSLTRKCLFTAVSLTRSGLPMRQMSFSVSEFRGIHSRLPKCHSCCYIYLGKHMSLMLLMTDVSHLLTVVLLRLPDSYSKEFRRPTIYKLILSTCGISFVSYKNSACLFTVWAIASCSNNLAMPKSPILTTPVFMRNIFKVFISL